MAQLYIENVIEEQGIVGLDIKKGRPDQRVKNPKTTPRFVPLHPDLQRMGFVQHVEEMRRQGHERVFPDLKRGSDGYYSSNLSRWFNEHLLPSVGAKTSKTSFHSFRHNYEDALKDAEVYGEWIDRLQGHKVPGMRGRYGSAGSAKRLYEQVCKVRYEGLDLSHLYAND